jgi:glutathione S-transferase
LLKLLHGWRSSASRRVRLCLAEKGLDFESHYIDVLTGQHNTPEYLAMNPNGVIPVLVHEGRVLYESSTICEYLDDLFPNPPIRPTDPYQLALMRNFVRWIDEKVIGNLIIFNWSSAHQPVCEQWSDAELERRLQSIPSKERREAWLRVARKPYTDEEKAAAMRVLTDLLDRIEARLAEQGPWMFGGLFSIAELGSIPFVARIEELNPEALSATQRPRVADWWARIKARPAYAKAKLLPFLAPDGLEDEMEGQAQPA